MPPRSCPSSARDRSVEVVVTLPASRTRALVLAGWVGGKERRLPALPAAREVVRALLARPLRPSHAASHPGVTATLQGARLRRVVGCAGPAGPRTPRRGLVQGRGLRRPSNLPTRLPPPVRCCRCSPASRQRRVRRARARGLRRPSRGAVRSSRSGVTATLQSRRHAAIASSRPNWARPAAVAGLPRVVRALLARRRRGGVVVRNRGLRRPSNSADTGFRRSSVSPALLNRTLK